jgi:hypothetical protein
MSTRLNVLLGLKQVIETALSGAQVLGFDGSDASPVSIVPAGNVMIRAGDPGEAQIDLSPPNYNYEHRIPVEVVTFGKPGLSSEEALDVMLVAIGEALTADRTLGGLCMWIEVSSAATDDVYIKDAVTPARGAELIITASYSTPNPLA